MAIIPTIFDWNADWCESNVDQPQIELKRITVLFVVEIICFSRKYQNKTVPRVD